MSENYRFQYGDLVECVSLAQRYAENGRLKLGERYTVQANPDGLMMLKGAGICIQHSKNGVTWPDLHQFRIISRGGEPYADPKFSPAPNSFPDPVNHPAHYTQGKIECIDAIKAALGREGFIAYLRGTIMKYQWRMPHKGNPKQDAEKSSWYNAQLVAELGEEKKK